MPQQLSCLNRGAYTHSTTIFWTLHLRYDPNELQRENCSCLKWLSLAVCYLFKNLKLVPESIVFRNQWPNSIFIAHEATELRSEAASAEDL